MRKFFFIETDSQSSFLKGMSNTEKIICKCGRVSVKVPSFFSKGADFLKKKTPPFLLFLKVAVKRVQKETRFFVCQAFFLFTSAQLLGRVRKKSYERVR